MTASGRRVAWVVSATAALALVAGACGDSDRPPADPSPGPENVIAPGPFRIEIQSAEIPADPTSAATAPTVTFRVTREDGQPIDNLFDEIQAGGAITTLPSFTLARLEPSGDYHSLYLRPENDTFARGAAAVSMMALRAEAAFNERVTQQGNGVYRLRLTPLAENPTAEQRQRTHTVGVWGARRTPGIADPVAASATHNFVPAGGTPELDQVVALQACNTCHAPAVRAHGTRLGTQLCMTCHTPQTVDVQTGNSVDFKEMVHKIHYGADLPRAAGQPPYQIVGFAPPPATGDQGALFVFDLTFINDVRNCTLCHQGEDANRHLTRADYASCSTCHGIVRFADQTPAERLCTPNHKDRAPCNHLPVATTANCGACHDQEGVRQRHVSMFELAEQFRYEIQDVAVENRVPTVRFRVMNTVTNQPRNLQTDPAYRRTGPTPHASAPALNVQLGWPSTEYTNAGSGVTTSPGQPRSISLFDATGQFIPGSATLVPGQENTYQVTFPVAVPEGIPSATVFIDGRPVVRNENLPVVNVTRTFAVEGTAVQQRRQIVSIDSCNECHGVLSFHGRNRNGSIETCVVCHNPKATDIRRRGADPDEETIDFKVLIHAIHAADIRFPRRPLARNLPIPAGVFTVYGFAPPPATGTAHHYPGDIPAGVGNCNMCHVGESWRIPLRAEVLDTVIDTGASIESQEDDLTMGRTTAVCLSCHNNVRFDLDAAGLTQCNELAVTNRPRLVDPQDPQSREPGCRHSGGLGEASDQACAGCHGTGALFDIAPRHPIR
jgi:OmcA/MtrC family decaheme c-type cytochrome